MNYYNSYELYHHGVKGQKWGVRRYQNEDGSLTRAGQLRYEVKDARSARNRSFGRSLGSGLVATTALGLAKSPRHVHGRNVNSLNRNRVNLINKKKEYKIEKKRESGASEEKLARMQRRADKTKKRLNAQLTVTEAINKGYGDSSMGRHVVTSLLLGRGSKGSIAGLEASGMTHRGAVAVSAIFGSHISNRISLHRADRDARRAFKEQEKRRKENLNRDKEED